ncbi:DNA-binding barrel domain superfamily [Sesbania bispinosa]|nr:DNA-binding barrel domain superfamily [Sesbania bispinosa]
MELSNKMGKETKFNWLIMEFDPNKDFGIVPFLLCAEFTHDVGDYVCFYDRGGNIIEISVEREDNSVMKFIKGWSELQNIYSLKEGAWFRLFYMGENEFALIIEDRTLTEMKYPCLAKTFKLAGLNVFYYGGSKSLKTHVDEEDDIYFYSFEKIISDNDISDEKLLLPEKVSFCLWRFNHNRIFLEIDEGFVFECELIFASGRPNEDLLSNPRLGKRNFSFIGKENIEIEGILSVNQGSNSSHGNSSTVKNTSSIHVDKLTLSKSSLSTGKHVIQSSEVINYVKRNGRNMFHDSDNAPTVDIVQDVNNTDPLKDYEVVNTFDDSVLEEDVDGFPEFDQEMNEGGKSSAEHELQYSQGIVIEDSL